MSLSVTHPGILSLLQDTGRVGHLRMGLSNGGPLDFEAFHYCNRLLQNKPASTAIEISVGGLQLRAHIDTYVCVTGADNTLRVNGESVDLWRVHAVSAGDEITLEYARAGCRNYLGVAGGFTVAPSFGSTATVTRENIGGLDGYPLQAGDELPCQDAVERQLLTLPSAHRPRYHDTLTVRVVPGYQQRAFSRAAQRRFFGSTYTVSERSDRMGYRLQGPDIACNEQELLSEGICYGAIQVPPDGQPIVLLNDRQTIGGYPKIGAAVRPDAARMSQLQPGATVHFAPVSVHSARKALYSAQRYGLQKPLQELSP